MAPSAVTAVPSPSGISARGIASPARGDSGTAALAKAARAGEDVPRLILDDKAKSPIVHLASYRSLPEPQAYEATELDSLVPVRTETGAAKFDRQPGERPAEKVVNLDRIDYLTPSRQESFIVPAALVE